MMLSSVSTVHFLTLGPFFDLVPLPWNNPLFSLSPRSPDYFRTLSLAHDSQLRWTFPASVGNDDGHNTTSTSAPRSSEWRRNTSPCELKTCILISPPPQVQECKQGHGRRERWEACLRTRLSVRPIRRFSPTASSVEQSRARWRP